MPSKSKPLTKAELAAYEAKRDLSTELLESVREMKAGKVRVVTPPNLKFKPVRHDHKVFLRRASMRPGFGKAYKANAIEYRTAHEMLASGPRGRVHLRSRRLKRVR